MNFVISRRRFFSIVIVAPALRICRPPTPLGFLQTALAALADQRKLWGIDAPKKLDMLEAYERHRRAVLKTKLARIYAEARDAWSKSERADVKDETGTTRHGTQKPVECMERPMRNHGGRGDAIYEPFSGSGSTIIAAERQQRACFAIELTPGYVQMAIDRWEQYTGQKAAKVGEVRE